MEDIPDHERRIVRLEQEIRELEKFRDSVAVGKKTAIWVLSTLGATVLFMLTVFEKLPKLFK